MTSQVTTLRPARTRIAARIAVAPLALTAIVTVGALARILVVTERATPRLFPDEFLYMHLARSLARGDGMSVLGEPSPFPALLQPLLAAPLVAGADAELAFRAIQCLNALAMALAAVPVFLLCRRLALSERAALACSAVAVVTPGLMYSGYVTADALGYLLALVAVAVAVRVLARPTLGGEALLVGAIGLATAARVQYAVLMPVALLAALVVERGRLRRAVRTFPLLAVLAVLLPLVGLATGTGLLGRYAATTGFAPSGEMLGWTASTALLLVLAAGVATVPGALAWLVAAVARPSSRERSAFAAVAALLAAALVGASVVMTVETDSDRFLERYLVGLVPLLAVAFACWVADGRPLRHVARVTALVVIVAVAIVPLATYTEGQGRSDSPLLLAVSSLADRIGVGNASLLAAGVATLAAGLALLATTAWRRGPVLAGATGLVVLAALSVGAHAGDLSASRTLHAEAFTGQGGWVDAERPGEVLMVQTPWSSRFDAMLASFWNTSVRRAAPLGEGGIEPFDGLSQRPVSIRGDGTLLEAGRPVTTPVLFATGGTTPVFSNDGHVVSNRFFALDTPKGPVRLGGLAEGLRNDRMLAPVGRLSAYPLPDGRCTTLRLRLTLPAGFPTATIEVVREGGGVETIELRHDRASTVTVSSTGGRGVSVDYRAVAVGAEGRVAPGRIARGALSLAPHACDARLSLAQVGPEPCRYRTHDRDPARPHPVPHRDRRVARGRARVPRGAPAPAGRRRVDQPADHARRGHPHDARSRAGQGRADDAEGRARRGAPEARREQAAPRQRRRRLRLHRHVRRRPRLRARGEGRRPGGRRPVREAQRPRRGHGARRAVVRGHDEHPRRAGRPAPREDRHAAAGPRRGRDRAPGRAQRRRPEAMSLSPGAVRAPGGPGDGRLWAHEARREGKVVARLEGIRQPDGGVVVEATVTPVGKGPDAALTRPFPFADVGHARRFVDDALESLEYLGCEIAE